MKSDSGFPRYYLIIFPSSFDSRTVPNPGISFSSPFPVGRNVTSMAPESGIVRIVPAALGSSVMVAEDSWTRVVPAPALADRS